MKRAVIAGATGVVGTALTERLLQEKIEVLILARKDSKRLKVIPVHPLVTVIHAGMEDYAELKNTTDRCWDVFYNLAWGGTFGEARNDTEIQIKNISYTLDAVKLAKRLGCHTFVGVGSQAEYGRYEGKVECRNSCFSGKRIWNGKALCRSDEQAFVQTAGYETYMGEDSERVWTGRW